AVLAFDVGGTDTKYALFAADGTMIGRHRRPTPRAGSDTVDQVLELVADAAAGFLHDFPNIQPRAVGLLVPGLVDDVAGIGVLSGNLGWADVPFKSLAESRLKLPVAFSHDVGGAGEAELRLGAARPFKNVAVLVVGTGVAGALFLDGRPYSAGGFAGEIGHSIVVPGGRECVCGGRGHLETVASAAAIARLYTELTGTPVDGAREVLTYAQAGDSDAVLVWDEAIGALALGISQLVAILAPEAVVIGGGLAQAGAAFFEPLEAQLDELLTFHRRPRLIHAQLGEDAGLLGAALRARDLVAPGRA
ncbi:MAG: ROK family protein, partial [Pseudolysinimonas sp.]